MPTVAVGAGGPVALVATYWGGVWHERRFDVLVEGERVATPILFRNRIGEFFEEAYPLPPALCAGKEKVTVRFQARPGEDVGSVFGLRLMRANFD